MTVVELIEALEMMPENAEVRIAEIGYRSAFEYATGEPEMVELEDNTVVYFPQGYQIGYLPSEAREELG